MEGGLKPGNLYPLFLSLSFPSFFLPFPQVFDWLQLLLIAFRKKAGNLVSWRLVQLVDRDTPFYWNDTQTEQCVSA